MAKKPTQTLTVRQVASVIGQKKDQRATVKGLGLRRIRDVRTLEDTPAVRGMINKIPHLVEIVEPQA